jgi:hypothetical protein
MPCRNAGVGLPSLYVNRFGSERLLCCCSGLSKRIGSHTVGYIADIASLLAGCWCVTPVDERSCDVMTIQL